MVRAAAVTVDAYGTLVTLRDPVPALREALHARGVERTHEQVEAAFRAEVDYYVPRSHEGRDEATLALLRRDCAQVFLHAVGADLDADTFAHDLVAALEFEPIADAVDAVRELQQRGVPVMVVSNWDVGLHGHLRELGLDLPVVTSAEAGAPKPDPAVFRLAVERLGVRAEQTVHIGDSDADREGAERAGMPFLPTPVSSAVSRLFPRRFSAWRVAAWLLVVAALAALNYAARFTGVAGATRTAGRNAVYHYSTAINGVVFYALLLFVFMVPIASVDPRELFAVRRPATSWARAIALAIGVILFIYVISGIVSTLPLPQSPSNEQGLTPTHWRSQYMGAFAANFVALALVAPLVEELTFRGVGYRLLEPYGRWLSIVAVGVVFGAAHGLVEGLLVLVPFGIAVTWLRSRTDSVYPGMLVHATFNGIALLSVLFT